MAGMIGLFLEVPIFGLAIKGAVLKLTFFYMFDAIPQRGWIFESSFESNKFERD